MLTVIKILEGGVDLLTQKMLARVIVVSNGEKEISIPIGESELKQIIEMHIEGIGDGQEFPQRAPVNTPNVSLEVPTFAVPVDLETCNAVGISTSDYDEPPPSSDSPPEDEGFQPGEEYNDSSTGVASV